ncbi:MAG: Bug family tripartite tricarboxylate transporter substrate binding protein [Betaproteobacteria bacterium]
MIVPFAAGGPTDILTRLAAEGMASSFGQPVVVENRPGAVGGIAADFVQRSPADGYTLLVAGQAILFINQNLYKKLQYDPAQFSFVGTLGQIPNVVVAHPDLPAKTMAELVQLAKSRPGAVSYGSNGIGSLTHLTTEMIAKAAGINIVHVPYQGAALQISDLMAGRIGFSALGPQTIMPLIRQGKLRPLAVSTSKRYAGLPDTPTLIEAGFKDLDLPAWFAIMVPAKTPPATLARLRSTFDAVASTPTYVGELEKRQAQPMQLSAQQVEALFAREARFWADAVKSSGATAE